MSDPKVNVRAEEPDVRIGIEAEQPDASIEIRVAGEGKDGYTPRRGVDYWTEEDQQEIRDYVDEQLEDVQVGGGAVVSVNGKTGAVALTAEDVGARSETWLPTADEIGAQPKGEYLTQESDPTVPAWAKAANKPTYTATEVGALPDTTKIPEKTSELTNDSGFLTQESDPTVPAWAKAANKPTYSKSEVGLGSVDNVRQYSASNPPPYPVRSVNGKTGAVALTADDVGAAPASQVIVVTGVDADGAIHTWNVYGVTV